jgi:hypothetical protein
VVGDQVFDARTPTTGAIAPNDILAERAVSRYSTRLEATLNCRGTASHAAIVGPGIGGNSGSYGAFSHARPPPGGGKLAGV